MSIIEHTFSGEADIQAMMALVHEFPAQNIHVVDLPYRFSSWAMDVPENIRLWKDENGRLLAWAILQTPFWTIDYAYRPNAGSHFPSRIIAWATHRARDILDTPSGHPTWYVAVFPDQTAHLHALEAAGFASQANVEENPWSQLLLEHAQQGSVENDALPPGFTIRPLAGEAEVKAYVALHRSAFNSKSMTVEWRARTLHRPEYTPEVDLVVVAPDGRLAAFCVGWLYQNANGKLHGQIEPLGVHADYQKLGLGRAVLTEGVRRMYGIGAERISVETDNYRDAAFRLYESVGFRVVKEILMYRKDFEITQ